MPVVFAYSRRLDGSGHTRKAKRGESWPWTLNFSAWMAWAYCVCLGTLIAFNAYMLLLARTSASLAASYPLVNPLVALCLGMTLGGEAVSAWEWLASGVVMMGVVLLFVVVRRTPANSEPLCRAG